MTLDEAMEMHCSTALISMNESRITSSVVAFVGIFLVLIIAPPLDARNICPNPSFELGARGKPADWSSYTWGGSTFAWDDTIAHSGVRSVRIENGIGAWSTSFDVAPGKIYHVSYYYRSANVMGSARVLTYAWYVSRSGERTTAIYFPLPLHPRHYSWRKMHAGDLVPPPGTIKVELSLRLQVRNGTATIWFDDVMVDEAQSPVIPETGAVVHRDDNITVWHELATRKIWKDTLPPLKHVRLIKLSAARGEYESFQIAVRTHRTLPNCNWQWKAFAGPSKLNMDRFAIRRVEYIRILRPSGAYGRTGLQPDPLPQARPVHLLPNQTTAFWFTVFVPMNVKPGLYTGGLILRSEKRIVCEMPISLRVYSFALPHKPSVQIRSNLWVREILRWHKGEPIQVLRGYYRTVAEHRSMCTPGAFIKVNIRDGEIMLDSSDYENHAILCHALGMDYYRLPLGFFIGHRGTHRMTKVPAWRGIPIFADDECRTLTAEFKRAFSEAARTVVQLLRERGWCKTVVCKFFDEPDLSDERTVRALKTLAKFIRAIHPAIQVETAAPYPHPELTDVITRWDLHSDFLDIFAAEINAARRKGNFLSIYNNAIPLIDYPAIRTRAFAWALWRSKFDGALCWWSITYWKQNPWQMTESNSGILLYPPRPHDGDEPVPSIRWELLREGLEDLEYITMLEQSLMRMRNKSHLRAQMHRAQQLLKSIRNAFWRFPIVRTAGDQPYPLNPAQYESWRREIADLLEAVGARH